MNFDIIAFQKINSLAFKNIFFTRLMIFFAKDLIYILTFVAFIFIVFSFSKKRYRDCSWYIILSVILSRGVLTPLIREIFPRTRPFVNNEVNLLILNQASNSFPSGHTAFIFALSFAIFLYAFQKNLSSREKKYFFNIGILFLVLSIIIGFARVFCGVHWPSDILVGALVGIFSALVIKKISRG